MKLEQQVVSLELAKKLKELGVGDKSLFYWARDLRIEAYKEWTLGMGRLSDGEETLSAFTVAELGDMFPLNVQFPFLRYVQKTKNDATYSKQWYWSNEDGRHPVDTEANARAKMLIYLLENNLITKEDNK